MDAMYEGLWQFVLAGMGVFGVSFIVLLVADLLPDVFKW